MQRKPYSQIWILGSSEKYSLYVTQSPTNLKLNFAILLLATLDEENILRIKSIFIIKNQSIFRRAVFEFWAIEVMAIRFDKIYKLKDNLFEVVIHNHDHSGIDSVSETLAREDPFGLSIEVRLSEKWSFVKRFDQRRDDNR